LIDLFFLGNKQTGGGEGRVMVMGVSLGFVYRGI